MEKFQLDLKKNRQDRELKAVIVPIKKNHQERELKAVIVPIKKNQQDRELKEVVVPIKSLDFESDFTSSKPGDKYNGLYGKFWIFKWTFHLNNIHLKFSTNVCFVMLSHSMHSKYKVLNICFMTSSPTNSLRELIYVLKVMPPAIG